MRRRLAAAAAFGLLSLLSAAPAQAGPYSERLGQCFVKATSQQDRVNLMSWVFSAMGQHPSVSRYTNMTEAQRNDLTSKAGKIYERLLTVDCRAEAIAALKNEGQDSVESSFSSLGQVAMTDLMGDPKVLGAITGLTTAVDMNKLVALMREAGTVK